jgi:hypothetical protein
MFPVTAEVGTLEIPLFARITKLPAVPRLTERTVGVVKFPPSVGFPPPESPQAAANESMRKAAPAVKQYDFEFIMIVARFQSSQHPRPVITLMRTAMMAITRRM